MKSNPQDQQKFRRLTRYEGLGHARELTFSCFKQRPFLRSARSRAWVVEAIRRSRERQGFKLLAWVVMPEHVHLLVFPRRSHEEVGPILKSIKQSVTRSSDLYLRSQGKPKPHSMADRAPNGTVIYRFWQRGAGYDRNLYTNEAICASIEYIHANPVRRGLCKSPLEWEWSGARALAGYADSLLPLDRVQL